MSGTVLISERTAWDVSTRAYLWAIEPLPEILQPKSHPLADAVIIGIETRILDLQEVSPLELRLVCEALKAVYADRVQEGEGAFNEEKAIYDEFLRAFRALIGLIAEDPRVGSPIYVDEAQDTSVGVRRGPVP